MKRITISLLLFSFIMAPVGAGEHDAMNRDTLQNNHQTASKRFFVRHKKPLIACAVLAAAGTACIYAYSTGLCSIFGDMNYKNEAPSDVSHDATITDYALDAWRSPFAHALKKMSGVPYVYDYFQRVVSARLDALQKPCFRIDLQHAISTGLKQAYSTSLFALRNFRSKLHDTYQEMAPYRDIAAYGKNIQDRHINNELQRIEVARQAQENCFGDDIAE